MNWQTPAAGTEKVPAPPWALESKPSPSTTYVIYDNGDGTHTAVVMEKQGTGTRNTLIGANDGSLTDLESICDTDWQTGVRK